MSCTFRQLTSTPSALRPRLALLMLAIAPACATERTGGRPSAADSLAREAATQRQHVDAVVSAGGVVDSIVPVADALARFRADLPRVDELGDASTSLEALVSRMTGALAADDRAGLAAVLVTRAEFAWLVYESSPLSRPPYEAPPSLLWGQFTTASDNGVSDLRRRFGGTRVRHSALVCPPPEVEGDNRLHKRCTVTFTAPGRPPLRGNLFGTIIERGGRFKLLSFANRI